MRASTVFADASPAQLACLDSPFFRKCMPCSTLAACYGVRTREPDRECSLTKVRPTEQLVDSSLRLSAGSIVGGRYQVLKLLGRGGMGEVYTARDGELDRKVALKVLPRTLQQRDPHAVDRFLRQARLAARVLHPAVVQVFDCGLDHDLPYVVQELLIGRTVADVLAEERYLEPVRATALLRELCLALLATHEAGVVHRDVKPDNLFLHRTGREPPQLKLLDFGLARALRAAQPLTRTHEGFGTLSYMAPEQLRSARSARIEADVYAVGSVLFELLTGRPPFVRSTRAELKLALLHDPAPDPREFVPDLPAWLCALCLRALAKHPQQRFQNVAELLDAIELPTGATSAAPLGVSSRSLDRNRLHVERELGRGAHGVVHAAVDRALGRKVALKSVRSADVEAAYRLKCEFRTLRELHHCNVVRAYKLFEEDDRLWLELELLDGVRFDAYVRGSHAKLHDCATQLVGALTMMHARGIAHGDLKSANVLVERSGRVVLVDFGLAGLERSDSGSKHLASEAQRGVRGTAADLSALGAMIEDALAAEAGSSEATASTLDPLLSLAPRLREREPALRPSAADVLGTLLGQAALPNGSRAPRVPSVGRASELASLRAAFQLSVTGRPCVVDVYGDGGMGKSTLLRDFLAGLPAKTLILRAGYRSDEQLPLSLLEAALDQLGEYLRNLPPPAQRALLPREVSALVRRFPALLRVEGIRELAGPRTRAPLDADLQSAAFSELRELLSKLSVERPIVLALEDLHWLDERDVELLTRLFDEPSPAPLLLVSTRRATPEVPALTALLGRSPTVGLELSALSVEDSLAYLRSALPACDEVELVELANNAAGHPWLLSVMCRARLQQAGSRLAATVESAIEALLCSLTEGARRLLDALCICDSPLPDALLCGAAEASFDELLELERYKLTTRHRVDGEWASSPYHAALRRVVLSALAGPARLELHRRFVGLLSEELRPASLVYHLAHAGRSSDAVELSLRLASQAEEQRRFDRAATLYQLASEHSKHDAGQEAALLERCARALHVSGRSQEAARALQKRLAMRELPEARHLERQASELLLLCGEVTEGLVLMEQALARHSLALAPDLLSTLQQTMLEYVALKQRGLVPAAPANVTDELRECVDLTTSVALTLSHVDLRGLPFSFRAVRAALDLGDDALTLKACAVFVWSTVSHFPNDLVESALELCRTLVERVATPYARALYMIAQSEYQHFAGRFLVAEAECERAEHLLVSECVGVAREISGVRSLQAFMQYAHKGDFRSRVEETTRWMAKAEADGNRYQVNMLRSAHALMWLAKDRPELARSQLAAAEQNWPDGVSAFEVTVTLFLDVVDRYEGSRSAHLNVAQGRNHLLVSPMARTPMVSGYLDFQRAWGALSALARGERDKGEEKMLRRAIDSLRATNMAQWRAFADACDANYQLLRGERGASLLLLEQSEQTFRELYMLCLAACARSRRGELTKGVVGERVRQDAERELRALGVLRVDKWCRAYFSPFDAQGVTELLTRSD
jgi:eukaryotic-like serine/threonine-protein kinase